MLLIVLQLMVPAVSAKRAINGLPKIDFAGEAVKVILYGTENTTAMVPADVSLAQCGTMSLRAASALTVIKYSLQLGKKTVKMGVSASKTLLGTVD